MRLWFISYFYPPDLGGGATRAYNFVSCLTRAGYAVQVISASAKYPYGRPIARDRVGAPSSESEVSPKVTRIWIPPIPHRGAVTRLIVYVIYSLLVVISAYRLKKSLGRPSMIFCQYPVLLASLVGLILSRVWGSSLVLDVPDLWPEAFAMTGSVFARPASFIARPLAFAVYKRADYVTTFGEFAKKSIASYGADESKIMSVFGGVDLEVFRPMDKIAAASSIKVQQLTEIFRSFVVMYIGTISRVYDIAILVKLAKQLENCPDLVVVVMGEGEAKSEILQEQSRRRLRNLIILPSVRDHSLVPYIINLADVCVIPLGSSLDPLANMAYKSEVSTKLFEYCACGKPVICLGRGEQGDIVTRSNAGEVFDAKDLAGLTNAILHLRSDRARLEQYARNSRALAEGLFSIENTAKRLESVVQQVMRGNRTTG